jgi:hypothetical protein
MEALLEPPEHPANRGPAGFGASYAGQAIQMLGDGTSVGVLKTVSPEDLTKPEMVKAYLKVIRIVFSEPRWIVFPEDNTPAVTIFLLDYLREQVEDKELQGEIDSTQEYVLKQAGPPKQSPIQFPSQSTK